MRCRRVDPSGPGISRQRRGRGFSYRDPSGEPLTDPVVLDRIRALAIPPAWRQVWICPLPQGHIQAVGTDDAGRRQYRYHDEWRRARDAAKFDRVARLGERLPAVRREIARRLDARGLHRERVLAAALRMLDLGVFRVGGEEYAEGGSAAAADGTFGLATLRCDHVRLRRGTVVFDYPAKGGVHRSLRIADPGVHKVVGALLRRRGPDEDLLAYRVAGSTGSPGARWHDVRADDVNAAFKELAGEEFSAKDLRTWNAGVLAAVALAGQCSADGAPPASQRKRRRAVAQVMREVSEELGNTAAVARRSYVDPLLVERFERGQTVLPALRRAGSTDLSDEQVRCAVERAVLRLLTDRLPS